MKEKRQSFLEGSTHGFPASNKTHMAHFLPLGEEGLIPLGVGVPGSPEKQTSMWHSTFTGHPLTPSGINQVVAQEDPGRARD